MGNGPMKNPASASLPVLGRLRTWQREMDHNKFWNVKDYNFSAAKQDFLRQAAKITESMFLVYKLEWESGECDKIWRARENFEYFAWVWKRHDSGFVY